MGKGGGSAAAAARAGALLFTVVAPVVRSERLYAKVVAAKLPPTTADASCFYSAPSVGAAVNGKGGRKASH